MNKAKALFAAGVIVAVAGASAGLWYLNENGYIGEESTSGVYEEADDNYYDDDKIPEADENIEEIPDEENETKEPNQENNDSGEEYVYSEDEISEFLSVFTKAYFYDNGSVYDADSYSEYELIRFAYAHINRTDNASIILEEIDDSVRYYYKVSAEKINAVLEKYLGITVPEESVYTENDHAFFRFSDSYFYTPAADGLPYINTAQVDTVEYNNGIPTVTFTVYSAGEKYAEGEAKLMPENDGLTLLYYKIDR